jgi:hypothetical protein
VTQSAGSSSASEARMLSTRRLGQPTRLSAAVAVLGLASIVAGTLVARWGPRSTAAEAEGTVSGPLGPVSGALVRFKGSGYNTLTDTAGRFRLPVPERHVHRITAWKEGYKIGGVPLADGPLTITLSPLPLVDSELYAWIDPGPDPAHERQCANCHAAIYEEWIDSAHARSASNPRFLSLYDGKRWDGQQDPAWNLLAEYPDGAGVCTSCHAPSTPPDSGAFSDLRRLEGCERQGVHCDFCHKIESVLETGVGLAHGRFGLRLLRPAAGQIFFGVLDDVDTGNATHAPLYRDSLYCATCHEGVLFGVHVYSTYSEWLESPAASAGQHCQSCHMRPTGHLTNLAPGHGGISRDPATLPDHRSLSGSPEQLRECLQLDVSASAPGGETAVSVQLVARNVGHRMPTGYIDRQLILWVEAARADGTDVALRRGPVLPTIVGTLAGRPGKLYAKQPRGFDGQQPVPFWLAAPDFEDSRLAPDAPDRSVFVYPAGVHRLRIRLIYRPFWEPLERRKGWPSTEVTVWDRTLPIAPGDDGG